MKLYIMRHGEANRLQGSRSDRERRLTSAGEHEIELATQRLIQTQPEVDCVYISPYIRAQQSAKVLLSQLKAGQKQRCDDITPDGNPAAVVSWLAAEVEQHQYDSVLLVSHMPLVSYLVHELDAGVQPPIFPTAGIAVIEFSPKTLLGQFRELLMPEPCVD